MNRPKRIDIKINEASSAKHLHQILQDALSLPDHYGVNRDAFCGVIEEDEGVLPEMLILNGWSKFEVKLPRKAKLVYKCLNDYQEKRSDTPFKVLYT